MPAARYRPWPPTAFKRFVRFVTGTSTCPFEAITDAGPAFIKAMGNPEGPHALAREWIGTHAAAWFGLPTFDIAILTLKEVDVIPMPSGMPLIAGPAFVSKAVRGKCWGGDAHELSRLDNPMDVARLIVFDTWIRNRDRYLSGRRPNYGNVFFSEESAAKGRFRLVAMDHTHCLDDRPLTRSISRIENVNDERLYGRFPEFGEFVERTAVNDGVARLRSMNPTVVADWLNGIPSEWEVSSEVRGAIGEFLCRRAAFVADRIAEVLCPPMQLNLPFDSHGGAT